MLSFVFRKFESKFRVLLINSTVRYPHGSGAPAVKASIMLRIEKFVRVRVMGLVMMIMLYAYVCDVYLYVYVYVYVYDVYQYTVLRTSFWYSYS